MHSTAFGRKSPVKDHVNNHINRLHQPKCIYIRYIAYTQPAPPPPFPLKFNPFCLSQSHLTVLHTDNFHLFIFITMPLYREDNYLVVHPGSESTVFLFGLQVPLLPPQYKIPSKVYRNSEGVFLAAADADKDAVEIWPIQKGRIVDVEAFCYLLRVILQSIISNNPIITLNQIPFLIVSSSLAWLRKQTEIILKYVLELLEFPAFNVVDLSLAATFGLGVTLSLCVVNVGADNIQVVPIVALQPVKMASRYLPGFGGKTISRKIQQNLPHLLPQQVEALKKSGIFEVLESGSSTFYSLADLQTSGSDDRTQADQDDDDDFDVARLVTELDNGKIVVKSDNATDADTEDEKPNAELEKNSFVDPDDSTKTISVGKERFQGTETLIAAIAAEIALLLEKIPLLEKRQECWDNLVFVGLTFKIPGFKKALLVKLAADYLIRAPDHEENGANGSSGVVLAISKYQQANDEPGGDSVDFTSLQVPTSVKMVKLPDYFPEWKKPKEKGGSWEDVYFLGGEIYAKQIFGGNLNTNGEMFLDNAVYEEKGPSGIWDVMI